jgi:hypothetical protein
MKQQSTTERIQTAERLTMSMSETSATDTRFVDKCSILAQIWMEESENPKIKTLMDYFSFPFRLCVMVSFDFAEPKEKGVALINELWDSVVSELIGDVPEKIGSIEDFRYWAKEGLLTTE